jgi:NTE family protein
MALYDLVFKGGGAKGNAFVGALQAFYEDGHKHRCLVGTSAGAITAVLLGAGYTPTEMLTAATETLPGTNNPVFTTFMDAPPEGEFTKADIEKSDTMRLLRSKLVPDAAENLVMKTLLKLDLYRELYSFNECGGFYAGNAFLCWFREKLNQKGLSPDITWRDFHAHTREDVSVVTSDTTGKEEVILNHRTAPDCPVAMSVRMSMSIPFVWREIVWEEKWGRYRNHEKAGHIFVDGGVLSNFPLRLVTEPSVEMEGIDPNAAGTIGLFLDATIPPDGKKDAATPRPRLRVADRVTRLIDTMTDADDQRVIAAHPACVCWIPVGGFGTTEFRMSAERQEMLINSGRTAMTNYLVGLKTRSAAA